MPVAQRDERLPRTLAALSARKLEPGWVAGEKAGYHQLASWFVLGEIVQHLDGRPFADYVQQEICAPLGMADCWVGMPAERYRAYRESGRLAPMYDTEQATEGGSGLFDHTFQHVIDWGLGFIVDSKQYGADTVPYAYGRLCSRRTYGHSGYRSSTLSRPIGWRPT